MKLQQAKIILEKINRLYQSMTLDENVDVFEKELMLSYIRQLYGAFSPGDTPDKKPAKAAPPAVKIPPPTLSKPKATPPPPPPPPVVAPEPVKAEVPPPPPPPAPAPPKPKPAEVKKAPAVAIKTEAPPAPVAAPPKPAAPKVVKPKIEHDVLFEQQEATDLSEKLSQSPIKDLTKAMGINEKILTIKELFDGDQKMFSDTMTALNGFNNFEQAKDFLSSEVATAYDWTSKSKKKKAKIFIKLVRRRYQ